MKKKTSRKLTIYRKKKTIETAFKVAPIFAVSKDFKVAIINIFKELKETASKELKEGMMTTSHDIENN